MTETLIKTAQDVAAALKPLANGDMDQEILVINAETVSVVTDVGGVDYIMTLTRVSKQRPRPARQ